jgi:hypothetical protein
MAKELEREVLWRSADAKARRRLYEASAGKTWGAKFRALRMRWFGKFGLVTTVDQMLAATGVAGAVASAGFAAIMITTDHSHPVFSGIEHLMLFAQPIHGRSTPVIARTYQPPADAGIDYSATGTIRRTDPRSSDTTEGTMVRPPATEPIIMGYVLQEAQIGVALVQGHGTVYRVKPGNLLPGAGRVLSVEQREDKWVVVTTQGIIADRFPPPRVP